MVRERRLVTLTGAGGCGKTRLAIELSRRLQCEFDAVVWVELAGLADASLVPTTVAAALGIAEPPDPVTDALVHHLAARDVLLVLDSCEHLLDACARLAVDVVRADSTTCVLATSRELLGIAGELRWAVPPLSLPDDGEDGDAMRLFVDRAHASQPGLDLDDSDARAAVVEICRRLDGIPLALELAAARTRMLSIHEIADGLSDRFRLLTGGERTALPRQRTLEGSVDWSYTLLDEVERGVLRRLSVFAGSFDLDAAQAVGATATVDPGDVFDAVTALVDQSLLQVVGDGRHRRYRTLETIREYAHRKLLDADETTEPRARFVAWCADFARRAAEGLNGIDHLRWLARIDAEIDNIRAALDASTHADDPEAGMRIVGDLLLYWFTRSEVAVGRPRVEATLDRGTTSRAGVAALTSLCVICYRSGAMGAAARYGDTAVAVARKLDDHPALARALHFRGWVKFWGQSDPHGAWADFEEARRLFSEDDDPLGVLNVGILGWTCVDTTRTPEAEPLLDAALATMLPVGAARANTLVARGWLRQAQGRTVDAATDYTEALRVAAEAGDRFIELLARSLLVVNDVEAGDRRDVQAQIAQGLTMAREHRLPFPESCMHYAAAMLHLNRGELSDAANELAATDASTPLPWFQGVVRSLQARVALQSGDVELAKEHAVAALRLGERTDNVSTQVRALVTLAQIDADHPHDQQLLHRALEIADDAGLAPLVLIALDGFAASYIRAGRIGDAEQLRAVVEHARADDADRSVNDADAQLVTRSRAAVGKSGTLGAAVAGLRRRPRLEPRTSYGWDSLTVAERNVVALVTEGLTNPQIGKRLFVSPRTVQSHLAHVFVKLQVSTRAELAVLATQRAVEQHSDSRSM